MLSYLKGILKEKKPTEIVIDINGIGFQIFIPVSSYDKLGDVGTEAKILTHLHVREDAMILFGFVTMQERELFELLLSISGIGPKMAIGILSSISVDEFRNSIINRNYTTLTAINGIGKKTAERLVLELFDKISKSKSAQTGLSADSNYEIKNQAIQALCSLGFTRNIAEKSVASVILDSNQNLSVEELIRKALKVTSA
jgi:holliday junction DNA helicase RuvA